MPGWRDFAEPRWRVLPQDLRDELRDLFPDWLTWQRTVREHRSCVVRVAAAMFKHSALWVEGDTVYTSDGERLPLDAARRLWGVALDCARKKRERSIPVWLGRWCATHRIEPDGTVHTRFSRLPMISLPVAMGLSDGELTEEIEKAVRLDTGVAGRRVLGEGATFPS